MSKKKQVGKGLRALLSNVDKSGNNEKLKKQAVAELSSSTQELSIRNIEANPYQPRKDFRDQDLKELTQSIKTHGLIQPITVRSMGGNKFQIIAGERRWRASKKAGLKTVPAYIRVADDQGILEMAIVENVQRSDLNPVEIAVSFQRLIDECDLSHDAMAKRVGKNRSTVTNYLRLLKLPPKVQVALKDDVISMGHAKAIIGLELPEAQLSVFKVVVADKLSVRETEKLIKSYKTNPTKVISKSSKKKEHPEVVKIRKNLIRHLGAKVEIQRSSKGKGKISIHFDSDDQFNDIIEMIDA